MATFWRLFEESVILQGFVTLGFSSVALYLWAVGKPVPDGLVQGLWAILGFWFGTKVQHAAQVAVKKREE